MDKKDIEKFVNDCLVAIMQEPVANEDGVKTIKEHITELVNYCLTRDRAERGDIVARLEKLAEEHGHVELGFDAYGWWVHITFSGMRGDFHKTEQHPTIPAALEAAEAEMKKDKS